MRTSIALWTPCTLRRRFLDDERRQHIALALDKFKPGHWALGKALGRGGQGLVFSVSSAGGTEAVKVVPYKDAEGHKLKREAQFLQMCSDENVIRCSYHWCHEFSAECAHLPRPLASACL